jgi:hypothetical protein
VSSEREGESQIEEEREREREKESHVEESHGAGQSGGDHPTPCRVTGCLRNGLFSL